MAGGTHDASAGALPGGLVALLFTDLVRSTELLERLGDAGAEAVRREHFGLLREAIGAARGQEVKTLGDGVMAVFGSAVEAVECAVAMQRAAGTGDGQGHGEPLSIRVGVHVGEPVRDGDDFFGTAVVVARRLCDAAVGGQILASDLVRGLVEPRGEHRFCAIGPLPLRGLNESMPAFEVTWEASHAGAATARPPRPARSVRDGVLRTRLVPPSLPRTCLPRPELVQRILDGLDGRLVSVVAGAGYGKTTLLTQALAETGMPWTWLSCDERIGSPEALLAHLAAGLGGRFPGVGSRLALEGSVEDQADELCNEVALTVADDFVMAIDDLHTLPAPATAAVRLLVRHLPSTVHLALASRSALPFPVPRQAGRVHQIDERSLALTPQECSELLGAEGDSAAARSADRLHELSEGWLTGVLLAVGAGVMPDPRPLGEDETMFDYLAEEVLAREPPEVRDFLLATAVLERFTPELAQAVWGRPGAREIIATLLTRHLFTVQLASEGEWYRYHHLFSGFLRERLRAVGHPPADELHARAAEAWLAAGEPAEAVRHFLRAGAPGRAADAMETVAEQMATTPEASTLAAWFEAIPRPLWEERPGSALAHASLLFGRGDYDEAVPELERAVELLLQTGEQARAATAVARLLQSLTGVGAEPEEGIAAAERFLPRLDPDSPMVAGGRLMVAGFLAQAGRYDDAEVELATATGSAAATRHPSLAVCAEANRAFFLVHPLGRSRAALGQLDRAIAWLDAHGADDPLTYLVWAESFRAIILAHLGRWDEALDGADRWRQAWERRGGTRRAGERSSSWVRFGAYAALGRWPELERELAAAAETAAALPGTIYALRFHAGRAQLAAQRGDRETVAAVLEMSPTGAAFPRSMLLCDLALAAREVGLDGAARELARDALESAKGVSAPWAAARAALVGAAVWGPGEDGDRCLADALETCDRPGFEELWTRRERGLAPGLLGRALTAGVGRPDVAARLALACGAETAAEVRRSLTSAPAAVRAQLAEELEWQPAADAGLVRMLLSDGDATVRGAAERARQRIDARPRAPLRITALGRFSVVRGGMPVPELSRGHSRPRVLLALLIAADGPVHREALMEWLWPHLAPPRALASLHTTLHTLRRLLDPEGTRPEADRAIATDGQAYRLSIDERDDLDLRDLLRLAAEARERESGDERIERLLAAEPMCAAPLLPEWPYEDWAGERREQVRRTQEWTLATLAEELELSGQPLAAVSRYRLLLEMEPEREAWHRGLMRVYARAGERGLALRQFHACRTTLREQLGSDPSAETRALYSSLL